MGGGGGGGGGARMIRSNNKIQFTALAYSVIIVTTSGYVKGLTAVQYCMGMN